MDQEARLVICTTLALWLCKRDRIKNEWGHQIGSLPLKLQVGRLNINGLVIIQMDELQQEKKLDWWGSN